MENNNNKHSLVDIKNDSMKAIVKHDSLDGLYASFNQFQAAVMEKLKDTGEDQFIDRNLYFCALSKLGIISRGRVLKLVYSMIGPNDVFGEPTIIEKKGEYPQLEETKMKEDNSSWYPPKAYTDSMNKELWEPGTDKTRTVSAGIYRIKNGNYGFNCENQITLEIAIIEPVVELLTAVNQAIGNSDLSEDELKALDAMGISRFAGTKIKKEEAKTKILGNCL